MRIRYLITVFAIATLISCSQDNRKQNAPIYVAIQAAMDESIKNSDAIGVYLAIIFPAGKM